VAHVDDMLARLHPLLREGDLARGVLGGPGIQLEFLDEDAAHVQREHWFDACVDLDDAAKLAALLDLAPETWQRLGEFRPWVHALRDAKLQKGSVTVAAIQQFVTRYAAALQDALGVEALPPLDQWTTTPSATRPALIENPPLRRYSSMSRLAPFTQFALTNKGLDETAVIFQFTGLATGPENVPVLVNLTTGDALVFMGELAPGRRLVLRASADGKSMVALLEGEDATAQLYAVADVRPGEAWNHDRLKQPVPPMRLGRGRNDFWFLPVAHFDVRGLDRFTLALPDLRFRVGAYDQSQFGLAVFDEEARSALTATWLETQPATFTVELPAGALLADARAHAQALEARERLGYALGHAIDGLRAAAVKADVRMRAHDEIQLQLDRLKVVPTLHHIEVAPMGAVQLRATAGAFELSSFDGSTFS
jgi:hypothetical protein